MTHMLDHDIWHTSTGGKVNYKMKLSANVCNTLWLHFSKKYGLNVSYDLKMM